MSTSTFTFRNWSRSSDIHLSRSPSLSSPSIASAPSSGSIPPGDGARNDANGKTLVTAATAAECVRILHRKRKCTINFPWRASVNCPRVGAETHGKGDCARPVGNGATGGGIPPSLGVSTDADKSPQTSSYRRTNPEQRRSRNAAQTLPPQSISDRQSWQRRRLKRFPLHFSAPTLSRKHTRMRDLLRAARACSAFRAVFSSLKRRKMRYGYRIRAQDRPIAA